VFADPDQNKRLREREGERERYREREADHRDVELGFSQQSKKRRPKGGAVPKEWYIYVHPY